MAIAAQDSMIYSAEWQHLQTFTFGEINDADMRRALAQCNGIQQDPNREILHSLPVEYSIDSTKGIRDPVGMFAEKLGIDLHIVTARSSTLRNLASCISRCHL